MPSLHFKVYGEGKSVVFLHGFGLNHTMWLPLANKLKDSFKLYLIDLPGFGQSPLPNHDFEIHHIAEILNNFLLTEGIEQFSLVGHSLGGYVALAMIEARPVGVDKLVMFHSTATADTEEKKHNRNKTITFLQKHGGEKFLASFIPSLFAKQDPKLIEEILLEAKDISTDSLLAYTKAMRDRPDRQEFLKLPRKVHFIGGAQDPILPSKLLENQSHRIINGSFSLFQDTGHMGMLEAPELAAAILKQALAS
ncbi:MAG TPA: alpha/beta hydrolase [Cyclobacteriaceae bacterium]|nr:alpha/beta hydrolase [Cyclobacteriaceae bacterium]